MEENMKIEINKHMYFDKEMCTFYLTHEASNIIYREKNIICSYSGSDEWIHHFTCEMLDLYSGSSIYNYALGTYKHKERFNELVQEGQKEVVIEFIERSLTEQWSLNMYKSISFVIDNLVAV